MKKTVNQSHIRSINQRVILDSIFKTDAISRAELSRKLNLSKVAIAENLSLLLELGIVQEIGVGQTQIFGGRRPILLQFNKNYQYIIAIDMGYEDTIFSLANLSGEIQNKFTIQVNSTSPYPIRLELVKNAINVLLSSRHLTSDNIAVIALSAPGIVHPHDFIYQANEQFRNWQVTELSLQLKSSFSTDVLIVNDVNAAALGEFHYGAGKSCHSLLHINCGLGIGAGIILNGALHEGESKSAGEIGNFITDVSSKPPITLEKQINIETLLNRIRCEASSETLTALCHNKPITFKHVARLWQEGDPFIDSCIVDIAKHLAIAISNAISLLDVDLVILGGEYATFSRRILPIINQIVEKTAFSPIPVVCTELDYDASLYGLHTVARDKIFQQICNRSIRINGKTTT